MGDHSTGALAFKAGDMIRIRLDRDAGAVTFQIRDLDPFTLRGVGPRARPFVNLACRGDGVTLLGGTEEIREVAVVEKASSCEAAAKVRGEG